MYLFKKHTLRFLKDRDTFKKYFSVVEFSSKFVLKKQQQQKQMPVQSYDMHLN